MAPLPYDSQVSSVEAHNGSATSSYCDESTYYPPHNEQADGDYAEQAWPQSSSDYGTSSAVNYADGYEPHVQSQSTESCYYPPANSHVEEGTYPRTISVDDGENGNRSAHHNNQVVTDQEASSACRTLDSQSLDQAATEQHSPPLRRWSRDNAPDERMRLGLPRWENDGHRAAYENSPGVQAEQDTTHEHENPHHQRGVRENGRSRQRRHR